MSKKKNKVISGNPEKRKLEEMISKNFKLLKYYAKKAGDVQGSYITLEKPVQKRRTEAIMHYMPVVTEHFKDKYTQDTIQDIFTRFCCAFDMECHSIGEKDSDFRWSTAASIWILDELEESNKLSEVNFDSYDYEDGTLPPLLTDCVHPVEMLWSIIILMQKQMTDAHNRKLMFHSQNAKYGDEKSEDDIKYHSDFMNIIKLLNPEHVQNAVERLKQIIWKIMDIYFEYEVRYDSTSSYKNPERKMEYKYINHMSTLIGIRIPTSKITTETFNNFPDSVAEVLLQYHENFFIENPFELCFSIFYLIAVGDDLAWLYTPFLLILEKCGDVFPWCIDEEWFKSLDMNHCSDITAMQKLVYSTTKILLPRDSMQYQKMTDAMLNLGFSEEISKAYVPILVGVSNYRDCQAKLLRVHGERMEKMVQAYAKKQETIQKLISYLEEMGDIESENTFLNKALKEEKHNSSMLEKEISKLKQQNQDEHEELLLYREYMYYLEHDEEEEILKDIPIEFPYHTKRKIVCLGGSESWLKHISEKLKGVTFCKPDVKTNTDKFKYADEIWICMEGLKHKESFPVTNLAKKKEIPIHFFKHPGVQKCAEQLARHDTARK